MILFTKKHFLHCSRTSIILEPRRVSRQIITCQHQTRIQGEYRLLYVRSTYFHQLTKNKLRFETKSTKLYPKLLLVKSSENNFIFTCILPNYVFLESSKQFWKKSHFEPRRAGLLRKCQNSLLQTSSKIMGFQA